MKRNINTIFSHHFCSALIRPVEDVVRFEVGKHWKVSSIDRSRGEITLVEVQSSFLKKTLWQRILGESSQEVIWVDQ